MPPSVAISVVHVVMVKKGQFVCHSFMFCFVVTDWNWDRWIDGTDHIKDNIDIIYIALAAYI